MIRSYYNYPTRRWSKEQEKGFAFLGIILMLIFLIWAIQPWVKQHIWQSVLIAIAVVSLIVTIILKSPRYTRFRGFLKFIFSIVLLPYKIYKLLKRKSENNSEETAQFPPLTQQQKNFLLDKTKNECEYCGDHYTLDVHHITPRSKGGSNQNNNLIVLCVKCHRMAHGGGISRTRLQSIAANR